MRETETEESHRYNSETNQYNTCPGFAITVWIRGMDHRYGSCPLKGYGSQVWIMGYGSHVVPGYGSEPYILSYSHNIYIIWLYIYIYNYKINIISIWYNIIVAENENKHIHGMNRGFNLCWVFSQCHKESAAKWSTRFVALQNCNLPQLGHSFGMLRLC